MKIKPVLCFALLICLGITGSGFSSAYADDASTFAQTEAAANAGDLEAQHQMGQIYTEGKGVTKDQAVAAKWYRLAAEKGYARSQNNLGFLYYVGEGVAQDDATAVKWYRLAADQGLAHAQYLLGYMYATGRGVAQDDAEAVRYFKLSANQGFLSAQMALAFCYVSGKGVAKDDAESFKWYLKAAQQGYPEAQTAVAGMLEIGQGVTANPSEAKKWYRLAVDQGFDKAKPYLERLNARTNATLTLAELEQAAGSGEADAQFRLGYKYYAAEGVAQNYVAAEKWWRLAAEQGLADAQYRLGTLYFFGWGVRLNYYESARWMKLAATQGNVPAQFILGTMYNIGYGVPEDEDEARRWLGLASQQDNEKAKAALAALKPKVIDKNPTSAFEQHKLAFRYHKGDGVPQSYAVAGKWYNLAAGQWDGGAKKNLRKMKRETDFLAKKDRDGQILAAAQAGDAISQRDIGNFFFDADGDDRNEWAALNWYTLASRQGDARAQAMMGYYYANGIEVARDDKAAVEWYRLAAAQGDETAQYNLAMMADADRGGATRTCSSDEIAMAIAANNRVMADYNATLSEYNLLVEKRNAEMAQDTSKTYGRIARIDELNEHMRHILEGLLSDYGACMTPERSASLRQTLNKH